MTNLVKIVPACGFAIAVLLVVATSSFKGADKTNGADEQITFEYVAPASNPYSNTNVQDLDNWKETQVDPGCDGLDIKACTITVPDNAQYVDHSAPSARLESSFTIQTSGTTTTSYVSGTSAQSNATIVNKSN